MKRYNNDPKVEEYLNSYINSNVVHVYNSFGYLPWQDKENNIPYFTEYNKKLDHNSYDEFQPKLISEYVTKAANNISFMYGNEPSEQVKKAKDILLKSEQIYFLGFGYHNDNLDKLGFRLSKLWAGKQIKGTAYELDDFEIDRIVKFTGGILNTNNLVETTCKIFINSIRKEVFRI